jgi:hypothetical protein
MIIKEKPSSSLDLIFTLNLLEETANQNLFHAGVNTTGSANIS